MDELFDIAWEQLYALIQKGVATLDFLLSYLHFLGPITVIFLLAAFVVGINKFLKKHIRTKRYTTLEQNFKEWMEVREVAMKCEDSEKGRNLAKNIDKAHLNRAYYDYFLEGLLLGLITFYLPVVCMATYINEAYRAERLADLFGRGYIFSFGSSDPVLIGALFWFICAVLLINCSIFFIKWAAKRYWNFGGEQNKKSAQSSEISEEVFEKSGVSRCA